jgi:hypothetical protein
MSKRFGLFKTNMKGLMIIACMAPFLFSCERNEIPSTYDLTGTWKVVSFNNNITNKKIIKTLDNTHPCDYADNVISFTKSDSTSGKISGTIVPNAFSGDFEIDLNGGIVISNFISTMIVEPEWGDLFRSIVDAESYEVRDSSLEIFYNQKQNSISLLKTK